VPGFAPEGSDVAVRELTLRYLHAYGPATPAHFARWLAAPQGWAAKIFDALGDAIEPVSFEGTTSWVVAGDIAIPDSMPSGARLLPYFDAYVVGGQPRNRLVPGAAADRALAGGQAGNFPVLLVDGVVAGVWHQRRSGRKIEITVEPLVDLTQVQHEELHAEVERVGAILEGMPSLTIGAVTVGPHA
jgi:hypothetical protein